MKKRKEEVKKERGKEKKGEESPNAGIEPAISCSAAVDLPPLDIIAHTIIIISVANLNFHDSLRSLRQSNIGNLAKSKFQSHTHAFSRYLGP